jgi:ABC-2 type transport system permease protein
MRTLSLARATLRGTTWISSDGLRELARKERLWVLPLAAVGGLAVLGAYIFMLVGIYRALLAAGSAAGHPELLMFYALMGSWAFIFVTAVPLALSVLYYSTDMRMLLTLPVRPRDIVAAKGSLLYLYCLPVNLVFLVPALWLYLPAVGASVAAIVFALLHLVLSPLLPLGLAALLVLALMKTVNLSRFRVAFEVAGMVLGIALVLGLQVLLSRTAMAGLSGGTFEALNRFPDLYGAMSRALPPLAWAANGFVAGAGPVPVLLSLLATGAVIAAVMLLAPIDFLRGVTERRETGARRRAAPGAAPLSFAPSAPRGVASSLLRREWAILSSNSTSLFEAFGEVLILPLLLGVYSVLIPKQYLGPAMEFITGSPLIGLILMGVLVSMTNLTTVSATSLSREGRLFSLSLTMPVSGRTQVKAKLLLHMLLFTTAYMVDLVICWIVFRYPLVSLVFLIPGGIALQVAGFVTGIFFDLKRPLLKWTHPQQAMKSNSNAAVGIGVSFGLVALLAAPGALLVLRGVRPFLVGCGVAAVAIVMAAILLPALLSYADKRYGGGLELEV